MGGLIRRGYRLEDINVKSGPNPADQIILVERLASVDATTNVLRTPFAPGTQVLVVPIAQATVAADGTVTLAANPEPSAGNPGGFLIFGRASETQGGVPE
jgi:hypothetical protein